MFASVFTLATLALATVSSVAAAPTAAHAHAALAGRNNKAWNDKFEKYEVYHTRYLALNCQDHHNTKFFDQCCGPLLKDQKLSSRPDECDPKKNDDDCDGDDEPSTTSKKPSSSPTPTKKPSSTTKKTSTAKPTPTKGSGNTSGLNKHGFATFFFQNGAAGACGKKNPDSLPLVALTAHNYGSFNRKSANCGRHVLIQNPKNGKTVTAVVADGCPTCATADSLDLSTGAFDKIATRKEGMVKINWKFID